MDEQNSSASQNSAESAATPQANAPVAAQDNKTLYGILSYLGPLVIVSYAMEKTDPFVKFHIRQGFVLLAIEVAVWVVASMFWQLWMIINLINLATLVLSIIGILNVLHHKEAELPVVGQFSKHLPL